jgi:hypothetical protein
VVASQDIALRLLSEGRISMEAYNESLEVSRRALEIAGEVESVGESGGESDEYGGAW